eukprot:jgi/Chrpa1/24872/Chrysochromulina_OHIO_Genome00026494-RA
MVFNDIDADKSGTISYKELNSALRSFKPPPPKALRKNPPPSRIAQLAAKAKFKTDPTKSAGENFKLYLAAQLPYVKDLMKAIDEDGNGLIDKREWRKAVAAFGIEAMSRKEMDAVFESIDEDCSGNISLNELTLALRRAQRDVRRQEASVKRQQEVTKRVRNTVQMLTEAQVKASPGKGSVLEELGLQDEPAPASPVAPPAKQWAVKFVETKRPKHALLIVNVQNDLIDGTMALRYCAAGQEGYEVIPVINALRRSSSFDVVAICKEWHPAEHCSFFESVTGKTLKPRPPSATGAERTKAIGGPKRALEERQAAAAAKGGGGDAAECDDEAGTGEEAFEGGMRRNAMQYDAHDVDGDQKLDFDEFVAMVREREEGEHTEKELRERFKALDADGSGQIDMNEYVLYSLCDALARSSSRVIDLFRQWDEDGSGEVDRKEFRRAVKAMGFDFFANDAELDMVFNDIDA